MADPTIDVLKDHFRQLRLPTMGQEFEKLARDAAATNQNFFQFLLRRTETELSTRAANAIATRIKNAEFPVLKDFDTFRWFDQGPLEVNRSGQIVFQPRDLHLEPADLFVKLGLDRLAIRHRRGRIAEGRPRRDRRDRRVPTSETGG
jgi:IstB-like ATP binding protein